MVEIATIRDIKDFFRPVFGLEIIEQVPRGNNDKVALFMGLGICLFDPGWDTIEFIPGIGHSVYEQPVLQETAEPSRLRVGDPQDVHLIKTPFP